MEAEFNFADISENTIHGIFASNDTIEALAKIQCLKIASGQLDRSSYAAPAGVEPGWTFVAFMPIGVAPDGSLWPLSKASPRMAWLSRQSGATWIDDCLHSIRKYETIVDRWFACDRAIHSLQ